MLSKVAKVAFWLLLVGRVTENSNYLFVLGDDGLHNLNVAPPAYTSLINPISDIEKAITKPISSGHKVLEDEGELNAFSSFELDELKNLVTDQRKKYFNNIKTGIMKLSGSAEIEQNDSESKTEGKEAAVVAELQIVAKGIGKAIGQINSEDPKKAAAGVFELIDCIATSDLFKTMVPGGGAISEIVSSICGLVCSFLVEEEVARKPTQEDIVRKVIRQELTEFRKDDLLSKCKGKVFDATLRLRVLSTLMIDVYQADLSGASEDEKRKITAKLMHNMNLISTNDFLLSNLAGFLEELWHFIELYGEDKDKNKQQLAADVLVQYVILSHLRNKELALLSGLYAATGAHSLVTATVQIQNERRRIDDERMRFIFHHPETAFHSHLREKNEDCFPMINALQPVSKFEGEECSFKFVVGSGLVGYLKCSEEHVYYANEESTKSQSTKFKLYKHTLNGNEVFGLYSLEGKGFIVPISNKKKVICKKGRMGDEKYGWCLEMKNSFPPKCGLTWLSSDGQKKYLKLTNYKQSTSTLQSTSKHYNIDTADGQTDLRYYGRKNSK